MISISTIEVGAAVCYQPSYMPLDKFENGIVKEIPTDSSDCVRVVYHCGEDWENYKNYTGALTNIRDLELGWKYNNTNNE